MSPPAEKARPSPVTIRARIGARSASHGAITASSPIISGLIAFMASGRDSVSVPIGPSDLEPHGLQLGRGRCVTGSLIAHSTGVGGVGIRRECMAAAPPYSSPDMAGTGRQAQGATEPRGHLRAAQAAARPARRLHVQRRRRPGRLRRQVAVDPQAGRQPLLVPHDARQARRRDRVDRLPRHRDRGRGADRRAAVHQAPSADPQRQAARRQVLSLHRDQPRRGVPARLLHPRAPPAEPRLLRALRERASRPRDARAARQAVPVPDLRRRGAGAPLRRALPRLLHQALRGALRRLHRRHRVRPQHRRDPPLPLGPLPRGRARPDREDGGGRRPPRSSSGRRCSATGSPRSAR